MATISPTQSNAQAALTAFLDAVLPGLAGSSPAVFVGSIAGTTLTVAALPNKQPAGILGAVEDNAPLLGLGVAPGTTIIAPMSVNPDGTGTYEVAPSQTVQSTPMSTGVAVVAGQQNRVPEPVNPYFVVFTPLRFERIETNFDEWADVQFEGSITGGVLTVATVAFGAVLPGATVFGTGVSAGTAVIDQISGVDGGPGTYSVSQAQAAPTQTMASGALLITQGGKLTIQLDFHSPDTIAGDLAQTVSTLFRDEFATSFFAALAAPLNGITPLYADDPNQRPFINAENQFEWRWGLDAQVEVNQQVAVPQQFFTSATVTPKSIQATFPP